MMGKRAGTGPQKTTMQMAHQQVEVVGNQGQRIRGEGRGSQGGLAGCGAAEGGTRGGNTAKAAWSHNGYG